MDGAFEPRLEDYRLLIGAGNFQDDEATAGAAWGVFVRSRTRSPTFAASILRPPRRRRGYSRC